MMRFAFGNIKSFSRVDLWTHDLNLRDHILEFYVNLAIIASQLVANP